MSDIDVTVKSAKEALRDADLALLEVAHVAKRLRVSQETVRRLIRRGHLIAIRFDSGYLRVDPRDLERFIESKAYDSKQLGAHTSGLAVSPPEFSFILAMHTCASQA